MFIAMHVHLNLHVYMCVHVRAYKEHQIARGAELAQKHQLCSLCPCSLPLSLSLRIFEPFWSSATSSSNLRSSILEHWHDLSQCCGYQSSRRWQARILSPNEPQ